MHAAHSTPAHEPLSQSLAKILKEPSVSGSVTMNELLVRTEGRGLYLLMILLCIPFVPLISPPGLSGLLGGIVMILSLFLAAETKPQLPRFLGARPLPPGLREDLLRFLDPPAGAPRAAGFKQKLISGGVKFLRFIERWI